jgi:hypothetical protein
VTALGTAVRPATHTPLVARQRSAAVPLEGFSGRVCLRSSRAVYVSDRDRVRFVLHDATLPAAPAAVVVEAGTLPGGGRLGPGAPVRVDGGVLAAGYGAVRSLRVDLAATPVHDPELCTADGTDRDRVRAALGRARVVAPPGDPEVAARVRAVLAALAAGQEPDGALDRLIGFGPGLTPSGDDALVAVLAALHRLAGLTGRSGAAALLVPAVQCRLARTTAYGAFHLEHACAGRVGAALADALDALLGGAPTDRLDHAVATLAAVGATSGRDLLTGLTEALGLWCALPGRPA